MKTYIFKIPNSIKVFFCIKRSILFFFMEKSLSSIKNLFFHRFNTKILFVTKNKLLLTDLRLHLKNYKNNQKPFFNTYVLKYLQWFLKLKRIKVKLSLVGIGFKFFIHSSHRIIHIKAGYSHNNFYKIPEDVQIFFLKSTEIMIIGNCYRTLLNFITAIKKIRLPDPYKKKGIFYNNERFKKKQGKLS